MEYENLVLCAPCVFVYSGVGFFVVGFLGFFLFCFLFFIFFYFFLLFGQVYKVLVYVFCFAFWPHCLCVVFVSTQSLTLVHTVYVTDTGSGRHALEISVAIAFFLSLRGQTWSPEPIWF